MTVTELLKQNWRQPKYMLPAIIYFPLLFCGYAVCSLFATEKAEVGNKNLETTEYLNSNLPNAHIKGDGMGNKYDSMLDSYGKIKDASAVENIQKEEEKKEEYESKYSDAELAALEQQSKEAEEAANKIRQMQESMKEANNRNGRISNTPEEDATLNQLRDALAQARQQAEGNTDASAEAKTPEINANIKASGTINADAKTKNEKAVNEISEEAEAEEVVKKTKEMNEYFNSIGTNEPERKLIKAIVDEDIKAVDGSRVRLRLLDDIEVSGITIKKGTYLYAIMSGFGSQRVKGTVKSIFVNDDLVKINLSIYDTDGLEGLYVPESSFRETAKEVGSQTLNTTPSFNTGTTVESAFVQWGMNAVQQGTQKISQAVSKNIKKNRVKIKYGTFVYLVNSKEKKKKQEEPSSQSGDPVQQQFQNIYSNIKR